MNLLFKNNIKLNRLKEMFYIEHMDKNHKLFISWSEEQDRRKVGYTQKQNE